MSQVPYQISLLAITAGLLVGCRANAPHPTPQDTDLVHYTGETPVWIFIPFRRITNDGRGHPARIALPPRRDWTTNRMEVAVEGEVTVGGIVKLRPGSTVLQAIACAGGFSDSALAKRGVKVIRSSGVPVRLFLRSRWIQGVHYREVWYDTKPEGPYLSPKDADGTPASDYVLEPGDRIIVARGMG